MDYEWIWKKSYQKRENYRQMATCEHQNISKKLNFVQIRFLHSTLEITL